MCVLHGKLKFWGKVQLFGRRSRGDRNPFEGMLPPVLYSSRVSVEHVEWELSSKSYCCALKPLPWAVLSPSFVGDLEVGWEVNSATRSGSKKLWLEELKALAGGNWACLCLLFFLQPMTEYLLHLHSDSYICVSWACPGFPLRRTVSFWGPWKF